MGEWGMALTLAGDDDLASGDEGKDDEGGRELHGC